MEVLFAVVILSIASLGVMSVLTFGIVAGDMAGSVSTANQIAREMIENIRVNDRMNFFSPDFPEEHLTDGPEERKALNAPPFDEELDESEAFSLFNDVQFTRNVRVEQVEGQDLARISVQIFWTQKGTERSVETIAFQRRPR